jgi:hypothetical protein
VDKFTLVRECFSFICKLFLADKTALEANCLSIFPLPDDHTVLTSQSELEVAEEVCEWHHEEFVAPPDDNASSPLANSIILSIPVIKVLVTLVDQLYFFR